MKHGVINGLIASVVFIVVYFIIHFVSPTLNYSFSFTMGIQLVIFLIFMIRACTQEKKSLGGYLGFGEAFITSFVTYAVGALFPILAVYFHLQADESAMAIALEETQKMVESMAGLFGADEAEIALEMEKNGNPNTFSFSQSITGWISSLLFPGIIYMLITSFISKKTEKSA